MALLIKWLVDPRKNPLARIHKRSVEANLRRYGLRYEDLYEQAGFLDIQEALKRLPKEVVLARTQRLKRAVDLSMKHDDLAYNLQAMQTPWRTYLSPMLNLVQREKQERKALGALSLRQPTIA